MKTVVVFVLIFIAAGCAEKRFYSLSSNNSNISVFDDFILNGFFSRYGNTRESIISNIGSPKTIQYDTVLNKNLQTTFFVCKIEYPGLFVETVESDKSVGEYIAEIIVTSNKYLLLNNIHVDMTVAQMSAALEIDMGPDCNFALDWPLQNTYGVDYNGPEYLLLSFESCRLTRIHWSSVPGI